MCDRVGCAGGAEPAQVGTFRRLAAFESFDRFLYVDADTLVLSDLDPLFQACAAVRADIVLADKSEGMAYTMGNRRDELLRAGATEWASGVFFSRRGVATVGDFLAVARAMSTADREFLQPAVIDQAFFNFCIETLPLRPAYLCDISAYASAWAWNPTKLRDRALQRDSPSHPENDGHVWLLHWAGLAQPDRLMPHADRWWRAATARQTDAPNPLCSD
jgi:hypothetical protein